jgi:hypothetical protein
MNDQWGALFRTLTVDTLDTVDALDSAEGNQGNLSPSSVQSVKTVQSVKVSKGRKSGSLGPHPPLRRLSRPSNAAVPTMSMLLIGNTRSRTVAGFSPAGETRPMRWDGASRICSPAGLAGAAPPDLPPPPPPRHHRPDLAAPWRASDRPHRRHRGDQN